MKPIDRFITLTTVILLSVTAGGCPETRQDVPDQPQTPLFRPATPGSTGLFDETPALLRGALFGFEGGPGVAGADLTPEEQRLRKIEANMGRTVWEGAALGAAAGALLGVLGGREGGEIVQFAVVGGTIGAAAGAYVAYKKKQYTDKEDQLDSMLHDIRESNEQTEAFIADLRRVISRDKQRLGAVESKIAAGQATKAELVTARRQVADNRHVATAARDKAQQRGAVYRDAAKQVRSSNPGTDLTSLQRELETYESHMDALDGLVSTMANV